MNAVLPRNFLDDAETYEKSERKRDDHGPRIEREALRRAGRFRPMAQLFLLISVDCWGELSLYHAENAASVTRDTIA